MKLAWSEAQSILRKGRAVLLFCTRLPLLDDVPESIQACYLRAAKGLEVYATDTLLPRIAQKLAEAPRRNRLHATMPSLCLLCDGEIVNDRWISLTLSLRMEEDGTVNVRQDHRVWDGKTGRLCPLEFFQSRKDAKKYSRWSFFLQEDSVGVIGTKNGKRYQILLPQMTGILKNLPPLS